jgi:hypothetical protein
VSLSPLTTNGLSMTVSSSRAAGEAGVAGGGLSDWPDAVPATNRVAAPRQPRREQSFLTRVMENGQCLVLLVEKEGMRPCTGTRCGLLMTVRLEVESKR